MPKLHLILVDAQDMSIRYIQIFTKNNHPEVPRWVRQRIILRVLLLMTGLVTHI